MIEVDWDCARGWDRYMGQGAAFEKALITSVLQCLVKSRGWEREQEPIRLPQPFFVPCAAVLVMEFPHRHSKSVCKTQVGSWCGLFVQDFLTSHSRALMDSAYQETLGPQCLPVAHARCLVG